jgi:hypothetical protein
VAAHFLAKDGTNLAGGTVPGSNPPVNYPGQTGTNTVALAPQNTMIIQYQIGQGFRASLPSTLLASVAVTSDQPIAVGFQLTGLPNATPCSRVP